MSEITKEEIVGAISTVVAIGEFIRDLGHPIPSGELYALVMGKMDIHSYEAAIRMLTKAGLIKVEYHLITYIG